MRSGQRLPGRRAGFTLVELLTVIAIIAILAGLLLPVLNMVQENSRQARCASQIADLVRGAKMYHDDWGRYPDALFGVSYAGGPVGIRLGDGKYVQRADSFTCPNHPASLKESQTLVNPTNPMTNSPAVDGLGRSIAFPAFDSYDYQLRPNRVGATSLLNYSLKWTPGPTSITDDPRQLIRKNPPSDTVVTWCLYHSSMDAAGNPRKDHKAIVGFLGGEVKKLDAAKLAGWPGPDGRHPWQVTP